MVNGIDCCRAERPLERFHIVDRALDQTQVTHRAECLDDGARR